MEQSTEINTMEKLLIEALDQVTDLTSQPQVFLDPLNCDSHFNKSKAITKVLYDATKLVEGECRLKSDHEKGINHTEILVESGHISLPQVPTINIYLISLFQILIL